MNCPEVVGSAEVLADLLEGFQEVRSLANEESSTPRSINHQFPFLIRTLSYVQQKRRRQLRLQRRERQISASSQSNIITLAGNHDDSYNYHGQYPLTTGETASNTAVSSSKKKRKNKKKNEDDNFNLFLNQSQQTISNLESALQYVEEQQARLQLQLKHVQSTLLRESEQTKKACASYAMRQSKRKLDASQVAKRPQSPPTKTLSKSAKSKENGQNKRRQMRSQRHQKQQQKQQQKHTEELSTHHEEVGQDSKKVAENGKQQTVLDGSVAARHPKGTMGSNVNVDHGRNGNKIVVQQNHLKGKEEDNVFPNKQIRQQEDKISSTKTKDAAGSKSNGSILNKQKQEENQQQLCTGKRKRKSVDYYFPDFGGISKKKKQSKQNEQAENKAVDTAEQEQQQQKMVDNASLPQQQQQQQQHHEQLDTGTAFVPVRQYYHSGCYQKMHQEDFDIDSDNELDETWQLYVESALLEEFTDVSRKEKTFMKIWNAFMPTSTVVSTDAIPEYCTKFIEQHAMKIRNSDLDEQLIWHLVNLWDEGMLAPGHMYHCMQVFKEQVREHEEKQELSSNTQLAEV